MNQKEQKTQPAQRPARRAWVAPVVADLPRLTQLTLQTGDVIPGEGDIGGGSTVVA